MSSDQDASVPREIVIVRRRMAHEEDGHHGGAWKIAFADLMTAMMAFFLVMWIINASDRKTVERIAAYFNPIKLNDTAPTSRGLHESDPKEEPSERTPEDNGAHPEKIDSETKGKSARKNARQAEAEAAEAKHKEDQLFSDPYAALTELAVEATRPIGGLSQASKQSDLSPAGGKDLRNPFEPPTFGRVGGPDQAAKTLPANAGDRAAASKSEGTGAPESVAAKSRAEAAAVEGEIRQEVASFNPDSLPNIEVKRVDEGLLISLTDQFQYGMFTVSSAMPRPELVVVMEKVAKVLASHPGQIVISGHTDARPFKSGSYDNWRLSAARAQMAYYMLVRGGVQENRVERIEGHADRSLKVAGDGNAAQNRRIEILLRAPKS
ncbi:MAG TPA: flagellar motor protein MotB [Hyphomicrobiaceae bacterium]|nr:flagellar motor protein MotB [Hyphomicrobiaceae bacterium]